MRLNLILTSGATVQIWQKNRRLTHKAHGITLEKLQIILVDLKSLSKQKRTILKYTNLRRLTILIVLELQMRGETLVVNHKKSPNSQPGTNKVIQIVKIFKLQYKRYMKYNNKI